MISNKPKILRPLVSLKDSSLGVFALAMLLFVLAHPFSGELLAQTATSPANPLAKLTAMIPMFILVFFIFYFLVIKPQNTKLNTQLELHREMKKGDQVVTTGGIVGKVLLIDDKIITLETAQNQRVRFLKDNIIKKYSNE